MIFILKHRDPAFTGVKAGVDFYQGQGSTSSAEDAARLVRAGCAIDDPAARSLIEGVLSTDRDRATAQAAARAALEAAERTPEGAANLAKRHEGRHSHRRRP